MTERDPTEADPGAKARPPLRISRVSKVYPNRSSGETTALDAIDLTIKPGAVTCLLGPSGSGKTTLLHLLAGFEAPTTGELFVGVKRIEGIAPERLVVFQQPALFPWLTVWENVVFGARAQRQLDRSAEAHAQVLLEQVGLSGFEKHYPYQLSGGMRQRVQIARSLLCAPAALLMDEPFGALDAQTRLGLQELMLRLWESTRPTVIFVTHDVDEAVLLGDEIVLLSAHPGRVREVISIALPAPRSYRSLTTPEFVAAKEHLLGLIHG